MSELERIQEIASQNGHNIGMHQLKGLIDTIAKNGDAGRIFREQVKGRKEELKADHKNNMAPMARYQNRRNGRP